MQKSEIRSQLLKNKVTQKPPGDSCYTGSDNEDEDDYSDFAMNE